MISQAPDTRSFSDVDGAGTHDAALDVLDRLAALPRFQDIRRVARAALDVRPGQRLLDAGCGAGEVARELAGLVGPEGEVTAVDASAGLIAAATARDGGSGVRYVVGDVTHLDFPDDTFDGVRCERVIQHVADPEAAVRELARVVRPGGHVCLVDTDWESFLADGMPADLMAEMDALGRQLGMIRPAGRLLRGQLMRAGIRQIVAEPVAVALTDRATAATVHPAFSEEVRALEVVPKELADRWFAAFDAALDRGDFLGVLTIWVVSGVKRP
jgi:ubiquinone/menaquinone biosynthesis C-methylase UbiE